MEAYAKVNRSESRPIDICLISPGLPSSNPRLVKEAAALCTHGYRVHCIVGDYPTPLREYDEQLLIQTGATFTRVPLGTRWSYRRRRMMQLLAIRMARILPHERVLGVTTSTQTILLTKAATSIRAKLYIGHTLPGLPAAVWAAERIGAAAGFDAEDFHGGETGDESRDHQAQQVEATFLARCQHLTAASPLIAEEYSRRYGVTMNPVLNTFPLPDHSPIQNRPPAPPYSLYWFSQTIGPGRGLEELIRGLRIAGPAFRLALRGIISEGYRNHLLQLAGSLSPAVAVSFLPPAHPDDMVPLAGEHHVGLSLELREPINRDLCLTNKVFTFLAAGIPQLLSKTRGHETLLPQLGDAAILVDIHDPVDVARGITSLCLTPAELHRRSGVAWNSAAVRFNWNHEQEYLLNSVDHILNHKYQLRDALSPRSVSC